MPVRNTTAKTAAITDKTIAILIPGYPHDPMKIVGHFSIYSSILHQKVFGRAAVGSLLELLERVSSGPTW